MNKGYIVAFVEISDFDLFRQTYIEPVAGILSRYEGKVIAASNEVVNKEGTVPPGFGIILEFPSVAQMESFYDAPDYQPFIKIRQSQGTSVLALMSQGMGQ